MIVFVKQANVRYSVLDHCNTFQANAKGVTVILFAVDTAVFQHEGIYHTRAEYLYPAGTFAQRATLTATVTAGEIHLYAWLRKWEERRTETNLRVFAK